MAEGLKNTMALALSNLALKSVALFPEDSYFHMPTCRDHQQYLRHLVSVYSNISEAASLAKEEVAKRELSLAEIANQTLYFDTNFRLSENDAFWITETQLRKLGKKSGKPSVEEIAQIPYGDRQEIVVLNLLDHAFEFPQFVDLRKATIDDAFNSHPEHKFLSEEKRKLLLYAKL